MSLVAFSFSCAFLFLELIIPGVIYLNLALACLITGGAMLTTNNPYILTATFVLSLAASFIAIRPRVINIEKKRKLTENVKANYIGKIAEVIQRTDSRSGLLSINNERWQARTLNNETIEQGQQAKITDYKDIVMYVERA